jgi:acyl-CoA hydrolase
VNPYQFFIARAIGSAKVIANGQLSNDQGHRAEKLVTHYLYTNFYMESKKSSESLTMMTEIVLPNDTNVYGNLMGGRLMYWMDIAAAIAAQKHCNAPVVTVSVDNISFQSPVKLGNTVHIEARVTRAFNTSMEIYLNVWGEDHIQQYKYKSNEAYYTFVALDAANHPRPVPQLVPETEDEKKLFEGALRRRQVRLILGGKMKPDDASELKALFVKD